MCFYSEYFIDADQVQITLDIMDEELAKHYPDDMNMSEVLEIATVNVVITDDDLRRCEQAFPGYYGSDTYICTDYFGGVNAGGNEIILKWYGNGIWSTALAHELLHTWEWEVTGYRDDHLTPHLFVQYATEYGLDIMDVVEWATEYRLSEIFKEDG
jgi:hypothetical protein